MTAERKPLSGHHIAAVTVGNAIEFYDFLVFAMFAIQIGHALFPPTSGYGSLMAALATFGAGFAARPVGALLIGRWSDRIGRRPAMVFALVLMGVSVLGLAFTPSYAQIGIWASILALIFRLMGGFALGGELGCNTAYLAEAANPGRRGLIVSLQGVSQSIGLSAAATVALVLEQSMDAETFASWGWRIALITGAIAIPFGLWLRTSLPEPPESEFASTAPARAGGGMTAGAAQRTIIAAFLVLSGATIVNYLIVYTATYAQDTLGMSAAAGFTASLGGFLIAIPAVLVGAWLCDRIGRKPILIGSLVLTLLAIWPCYHWVITDRSEAALIGATLILSSTSNSGAGPLYALIAEGLPRTIRGTAFGLVYAAAIAIFGGSAQVVATWLLHATGSPYAVVWQGMATAAGLIGAMMFRETMPLRIGAAVRTGRAGAP